MNFDVKFGMEYRGGGSVQADWAQNDPTAKDYVKNRLGGYEATLFDISWDGNLDGHTVLTDGDIKYVKVSDAVLTEEEIKDASVEYISGGETLNAVVSDVQSLGKIIFAIALDLMAFVVVTEPVTEDEFGTFETGVYFITGAPEDKALPTVRISKHENVKIPQKYLPENVYVIDLYWDDDGNLRAAGFSSAAYKQAVLQGNAIYLQEDGYRKQVWSEEFKTPDDTGVSTYKIDGIATLIDGHGMSYLMVGSSDKGAPIVNKMLQSQIPIQAGNGAEGYLSVVHDSTSGEYTVKFVANQ